MTDIFLDIEDISGQGPETQKGTEDWKQLHSGDFFFFVFTPCILIIVKVFSPTDAQLDKLKNNFKFALKLILKGSYMFRCEKHHPQGAHCLSLAKVNNCYNELK